MATDCFQSTNIYLFTVNNWHTRKRCWKMCLKLEIKTLNWRQWCCSMLTFNTFHAFFLYPFCWLWTSKCLIGSEIYLKTLPLLCGNPVSKQKLRHCKPYIPSQAVISKCQLSYDISRKITCATDASSKLQKEVQNYKNIKTMSECDNRKRSTITIIRNIID